MCLFLFVLCVYGSICLFLFVLYVYVSMFLWIYVTVSICIMCLCIYVPMDLCVCFYLYYVSMYLLTYVQPAKNNLVGDAVMAAGLGAAELGFNINPSTTSATGIDLPLSSQQQVEL